MTIFQSEPVKRCAKFLLKQIGFSALCLIMTIPFNVSAKSPDEKPASYPQRIISLSPILTENIYLLEAEDRLIANTVYCVNPPEASQKEKVGTIMQANIEKIISLKPDLVLAISLTNPRQIKKLENLRIRVVRFVQPENFPQICRQFIRLGDIIGKGEKAKEIIDRVKKDVAAVVAKTENLPKKKVFFQIGIKPLFATTKESFTNDYMVFGGGINIAANEMNGVYSREKVVQENPDVIIIAMMGSEGVAGAKEKEIWMKLESINAVKRNRIYIVDPDDVCSPSPATFVETLKKITKLIHPEISLVE
ncbi:MAG: helical backbone metal receptor [Pseudomonadota bacterium]